MNKELSIAAAIGVAFLALPTVLVLSWMGSAQERLIAGERDASDAPAVAVAAAANEEYCTPELQQILRRVLSSCGLIGASGGRGCQPADARSVATMDGADFNALFIPMRERGGIVQYDANDAALDSVDRSLVERVFADRRGASYFFVVSRASPDGPTDLNRELSQQRAEAVMSHLQSTFDDPELERQVGLLWLGEEYAQLEETFCDWSRSGDSEACLSEDLNRSAFIAWIDCQL